IMKIKTSLKDVRGVAIAVTALCMLSAPTAKACGTGTQSGFTARLSVLEGLLAPEQPLIEVTTKGAKDADSNATVVGMWKVTFFVGGAVWDVGFEQFFNDGNEITNDAAVPPSVQNICWGVWRQTGGRTVKLKHLGWT